VKELFKMEKHLSPRLAWMKNHRIRTHEWKQVEGDHNTFSHLGFGRWVAYVGKMPDLEGEGNYCHGDTEDEAVVNLARANGWKNWNEEAATKSSLNSKLEGGAK
jgi:hypothetical protein